MFTLRSRRAISAFARKTTHPRTRRMFLEQLERRDLLAVVPVAINDPIYNTPLNTQLTSSTPVVANDFDADSLSLTGSVVASPSNGTLNSFNSSTGQFVYTPNTSFVGLDSFTYKINNGTYDSNVATVTISVGGVFGPRTNLDDQPLDSPMYTGANTIVQDLSLGERLIYRSDTVSLKPVIVVETSLKSTAAVPNSISAVLTFNGTGQGTVAYTNTGLAAGDTLRFALQADATALATGMYDWSMAVTADYGGGSTSTTTFTGSHAVVNRGTTVFGKGWWLDGLDQLVVNGSGALLVSGNGDTLWFKDNGASYDKAAGDTEFSTLVENGGGDFTLTTKHGIARNFSSAGLLTSVVDRNGNAFDYTYVNGDGGGPSDDISAIEEPYGRDHSFAYSANKVSTFTDYASHATTLGFTSTKLTTVTLVDPDGGGGQTSSVWAYAYNGTSNLLETVTDPNSEDTDYTYNATSLRLSRVDFPTASDHTLLTPIQTYGLKTGASNALVETVNPLGVYTDEISNEFKFKADRFGNIVQFGHDFSGGSTNDVVDTSRDPNGLPYKILQPAIGGVRYQTKLGYNSSGDLLKAIFHDGTTNTWTYDSTLHLVLTATDEMARTTTYTRDGDGNELTREDNAGNEWVTDYTGRSDGLPVSITSPDPDGAGGLSAYETEFDYDAYGRLDEITFPDTSTQILAYNTADMVTSVTNENGDETVYAYDALNRLTSITGEDPDAGGGQSSPVTSLTYDAANNLLTQVDALSQTTSYDYDERNRVIEKTLPDPDAGGALAAPEFTFDYDGVGNVIGQEQPTPAVSKSHTYDAYGRKTDTTWGTLGGAAKQDTWTFDVLGRMTSYTNSIRTPYVQTDVYEYDSRGRMTKHTGHDEDGTGIMYVGAAEYFTYNYAGQPASHTDFLGNVTSYTYTTAGWLNSVTFPDSDGSGPNYAPVYTFGYDALGNQVSMSDANNHISTKTWNSRGRVASETGADPDGAGGLAAPTISYAYDYAGNLTSLTNPLSKVTSFGYDHINRRISMTLADPDGGGPLASPVYAYGYNAVGSLTTETDPLGNVTTTALDHLQRKTTVTLPDPDSGGGLASPVWTFTYGADSLLATITDPMAHDTDYGYDDYGRQITVTNHQGYVTTTGYDLLDQVTSITTADPDGAGGVTASVTTYAYDYLNRMSGTTDALSGATAYTYDLNNHLINLRDSLNNDTSWAYDNAGRVTMETNELNNTRSFWHDAVGNLTRKKDRNERVTQYTFDDLDRLTAEKWLTSGDPVPTIAISTTTEGGPINEVQRVGFSDMMGLTGGTFTLSFGGNTTSALAYNASAATVQTALQGLGSIGSGNISVVKSGDTSTLQEWTLTFQGSLAAANQSQLTIDCSNVTTVMLMPPSAIQATDANGSSANEVQVVTLSNATDGTFRLAFGGQTTAPIAYNASAATVDSAVEALQSVDTITTTGSNGGPWTITFTGTHAGLNVATLQGDAANTQSGSVSRTISYTYDVASQLADTSDADSTYAYTYDAIGRPLTVDNNGTSGVPRVILTSIYDAASNRTRLSATIGGTNDFKNDYTYDNMNRMTQVAQIGNGGNTVANKRANFAYNALSQFTSVERQVKPSSTWNEVATTLFTFDTLNRIDTIDHKRSGSSLFTAYDYAYDFMDRITGITSADGTVAYTYDKTSQLVGADYNYQTDETFAWDANGNPTGGSNTVASNNRLTADGTYTYTYDDEGNLSRRTKVSDSSYTDYTWDHRNRLTNVTNRTSGGTSTMSVDYTYDVYDRRIKKVVDADGAGGGGSVTIRYVYEDQGITRVVLQFDGASSLTHRYLHGPAVDQLLADEDSGNALLWSLTDHLGTVRDLINNSGVTQNHLKYGGFGNVTNESAAAVDFLMGFAGMDRDEETGASYSGKRYTEKGRWKSPDPSGFAGGDTNLTRYVGNSPVNFIDPTGLESADGSQAPADSDEYRDSFVESYPAHDLNLQMRAHLADGVGGGNEGDGENVLEWLWNRKLLVTASITCPGIGVLLLANGYADADFLMMAQYPSASIPGAITGLDHGDLLLDNALTFHMIPSLDAECDELIATNGGMYGMSQQAADMAAYAFYAIPASYALGVANLDLGLWLFGPAGAAAVPNCFVAGTEVVVAIEDSPTGEVSALDSRACFAILLGTCVGAALILTRGRRKEKRGSTYEVYECENLKDEDSRNSDGENTRTNSDIAPLEFAKAISAIPSPREMTEALVLHDSHRPTSRSSPRLSSFLKCAAVSATAALFLCAFVAIAFRGRASTLPIHSVSSHVAPISPVTRRIEDIHVGDRVLATENPAEPVDTLLGTNVDRESWRQIVLRPDESSVVTLLRPNKWIEERRSESGTKLSISVPEVGIHGQSKIMSIGPCPPIQKGSGAIVTGTFSHLAQETVEVRFDQSSSIIRCTPNHATWSVDRQAFVEAQALKPGEAVQGAGGVRRVSAVVHLQQRVQVFNLEVFGQHVYQVSPLGVLVHNPGGGGSGLPPFPSNSDGVPWPGLNQPTLNTPEGAFPGTTVPFNPTGFEPWIEQPPVGPMTPLYPPIPGPPGPIVPFPGEYPAN